MAPWPQRDHNTSKRHCYTVLTGIPASNHTHGLSRLPQQGTRTADNRLACYPTTPKRGPAEPRLDAADLKTAGLLPTGKEFHSDALGLWVDLHKCIKRTLKNSKGRTFFCCCCHLGVRFDQGRLLTNSTQLLTQLVCCGTTDQHPSRQQTPWLKTLLFAEACR